MKKILIVAYYFPPFGGVGAVRMTKLVKYFSKFGWDVTVATVNEKYYDQSQLDYDKENEIPSQVKIIRTKRYSQFTSFKEEGLYWTVDLYRNIKKLVKNERFDFIFYTGGPFFHWVVAPLIKRYSKIPYVLDFRDPWLLTPYNNSKIRKVISGILEPYVIKNADIIINVTKDATDMYKNHYKFIEENKFITISNGYDPEDFIDIRNMELNLPGRKIVYTGKFGGFRKPLNFLAALDKYNQKNEEKMFFIHVGQQEIEIQNYLENNPTIRPYVIQTGFVPYKKALEYVKASDIALIISGGHPYEPTTKIYDYIALKKSIFCINDIDYGYLFETLNSYSLSVNSKNEESEILNGLNHIMLNTEINENECDDSEFNRESLFKSLSSHLKNDLNI
ncbi:glycosyltransferase [Bacillus cereus group sp. N28]|uniref:glycosyltransferase n=1 Tax=Bacillus cereus group sp. N28 TaxID=2794593 RepID=UPI0018F4D89F|nr:glycosyltransferase [Bacillus cereus group sp. N28]MBJ7958950.1 glycosyltransferase [Bacillus cereus group sp. N28]